MQKDFLMLIESYRPDFTDVEHVIADYFLSKKPVLTNSELSEELYVSKSSISRFCKKIGLKNYKELNFLYSLSLDTDEENRSVSSKITEIYHSLATRSDAQYDEDSLDEFCRYLNQHKIIHFLGRGFNAYAGMDFQFKFSRLGKYVRVISEENSIEMAARVAEEDELIIISSLSGEEDHLVTAAKLANNKNVTVLLITANESSPMIPFVNIVLYAASFSREESLGNISPQIPILIQLDMVYQRYLNLYSSTIQKWMDAEKILNQKHD